jgi:serine phosphatase RsbU (regulator of sigma subunit)/HAMP domain-containing protein
MKGFRFTISKRIAFGFGLFILAVGGVLTLMYFTLREAREINRKINEVYAPSLRAIENLNTKRVRAEMLLTHWVFNQTREDQPERKELIRLVSESIPNSVDKLKTHSADWPAEDLPVLDSLVTEIAAFLEVVFEIRFILNKFEDYEDPVKRLEAEFYFESGETVPRLSQSMDEKFEKLAGIHAQRVESISRTMLGSFDILQLVSGNIALIVILFGIGLAWVTIRSIRQPISKLKSAMSEMALGVYPTEPLKGGNNEIGDMAVALNKVIDGLLRADEFSRKLGSGDFEAEYRPLSEKDELGHALLKMRDDLAANERELERKVIERTEEVVRQKEEIERQKERVTELYQDLTDSINYARRLQQSILPTAEQIRTILPDSFVLFRPRDIVSGDFYFFKSAGNKVIFAAIDCTGHGVPGAFMSLLGYNVLSQVCKVFTTPSSILNNLHRLSSEALRFETGGPKDVNDGMDLALCTLDKTTLMLEYAGAKNPALIVRNGEIIHLKPDKFSIGDRNIPDSGYTNQKFQLQKGDMIYLFSDGYADQFGGPDERKLMKKNFFEWLLEVSAYPPAEQRIELSARFTQWKYGLDQVDDVMVIGVRI